MQEPIAVDSAADAAGGVSEFGPFGRLLLTVSRWAAILGGILFVALVVMSIVSIVGRKLASAPVPGDVEILQMVAAFASALFFAYCHMKRGDVKVDFFTANRSPRIVQTLDAFGSLLVGLVGLLLAWRTAAGAITVQQSGETSMILGIPQWISQALMVPGFALLGIVGLYMTVHCWSLRNSPTTEVRP
ncbi:MAG: TRAP transporter small permease [Burkholderiales bacterium]|nr:TRAP transporter small permease [Burkholderiales bacterium]